MTTKYQNLSPEVKARRSLQFKAWRQAHPEKIREYNQRVAMKRRLGVYAIEARGTRKARRRLRLAGRPKPEYCECCGDPGKIVWDHCHNSRLFRGWICEPCNKALGFVRDSPDKLRKLIEYLAKATG